MENVAQQNKKVILLEEIIKNLIRKNQKNQNFRAIPAQHQHKIGDIMWIEKIDKNNYINASDDRGIRLKFSAEVDNNVKRSISEYCNWLRKKYFFPIRCIIIIKACDYIETQDGKKCFGLFRRKDDNSYPEIFIAVGDYQRCIKKSNTDDILAGYLHRIAHEITHYYQWFFFEYEKRTNRSLEMEATKWANYLLDEYRLTREHP